VKFKESSQRYKFLHVATAIATIAYYKNLTKDKIIFNIYERNYLENSFKDMLNSIDILSR